MSGLAWFKSSYSANNGSCVEVAFAKSSYSANNGNCVEVAALPGKVLARDSKNPDGGRLEFSQGAWRALTARLAG